MNRSDDNEITSQIQIIALDFLKPWSDTIAHIVNVPASSGNHDNLSVLFLFTIKKRTIHERKKVFSIKKCSNKIFVH